MKYIILFSVTYIFSNTLSAQIFVQPQLKDKIKIIIPQPFEKNLPQAKLFDNTDKGKVYSLPLDNMPCLVAIKYDPMLAPMNLKDLKKIPNLIPELKIIPETQDTKYFLPKMYNHL